MKFITPLILLFIMSCNSSQQLINNDTGYKVNNVDSLNNWYIIYLSKSDSLYKVVTNKEESYDKCRKIVVGRYYNLTLMSRKENVPIIDGIRLKPINYLDVKSYVYDKDGVECYLYDDQTEICMEPQIGINDIHYTEDIKGLCIEQK